MVARLAGESLGTGIKAGGAEREGGEGSPEPKRARRQYSEEEVEALVQERVKAALHACALQPVPILLKETFTPNDPIHGLMYLPTIVKVVVDTLKFQRMRQIKQLGVCPLVYPGATHNRFFHSIGTAYLAHELMKSLRQRQPELGITDRDALCTTLAALCHDLGHPCFSHMFELFIHNLGRRRRRLAEAAARERGSAGLDAAEDAELRRYETWNHEAASIMMIRGLFSELAAPFELAGLKKDDEGDDFAFICELIDPPKRKLEELLEHGKLHEGWSGLMKGRPVEKAWIYEVISNWRSGIDVDKFDYFRRDAYYLGVRRQFNHERYLKGVKVIPDDRGVPTISPPYKDKDSIRDNMMELRKMLHRNAYQHKTVKKLELHMIDILTLMDESVRLTGTGGRKLRMSEAAVELDPVAYTKLTDTFVEARLLDREDPGMQAAADEHERRIMRRQLMRLVADWDLPQVGDEGMDGAKGPVPLPASDVVLAGTFEQYKSCAATLYPEEPVREVAFEELRSQVATFTYGMGSRDPITRVLFHSTKSDAKKGFHLDADARPLRQKIFVFWNPDKPSDEATLQRLTMAFQIWAERQVEQHVASSRAAAAAAAAAAAPKEAGETPAAAAPAPASAAAPAAAQTPGPPARGRSKRTLMIQASCPLNSP